MKEQQKQCTVCLRFLLLSAFYKKEGKFGVSAACRECSLDKCKKYRDKNKEETLSRHRKWYQKNKELVSQKYKAGYSQLKLLSENVVKQTPETKVCGVCKEKLPSSEFYKRKLSKDGLAALCKKCNAEKGKSRYACHREEIIRKVTEYNKTNAEKKRVWRRKYIKDRLKTDLEFRLSRNLRKRLWELLRGSEKNVSAVTDLGCTQEELIKHLELQFVPGMSWDNYGPDWHVDHIVPLSWYKLEDVEEQRRAVHYTNLQPLFKKDNLAKGNRYAG
jgi:hypothetical protein